MNQIRFAPRYGLIETPLTFDQVNLFFAAPEASSLLLPAIDRKLVDWKRDPDSIYYAALVRASVPPAQERLPRWVMAMLPGLALLAIGFALLVRWLNQRVRRATRELQQQTRELENLLAMGPVVLYRLSAPDFRTEWVSANIVAEGLETEGQRDLLGSYGCTLGQGYLLGRPMTPERLIEALRDAV